MSLTRTQSSYDVVAEDYAKLVPPRFAADPLGRAMLAAFSEVVSGPAADVGCGPGQVTAHLKSMDKYRAWQETALKNSVPFSEWDARP